MKLVADPLDRRLLDDYQRDFPIVSRPFATLGVALGMDENEVLSRITAMRKSGRITRVGGTCTPNTLSASTLAAVSVPPEEVDEAAAIINAEPGVNHSYERTDAWNIWFVVTGPDSAHITACLKRIETRVGRRVLDLRMVRPFNVDLGFRMDGVTAPGTPPAVRTPDLTVIEPTDHALMQELTTGLPLVPAPYAALADKLRTTEAQVLARIKVLLDAAILSRLGVIVRHRALGWRSNAMVVWDLTPDEITIAGPQLSRLPGVTLCYERVPAEGIWPYRLYSMIHAKTREDALGVLDAAKALPPLRDVDHRVLFSTRCFRQTGAMITGKQEVSA